MFDIDMSEICWRAYSEGLLTDKETEMLFDIRMPYKGCGNIQVRKGDISGAEKLLKCHIGDYEFKDYPEGLITDNPPYEYFYNGKFQIEDLKGFLKLLTDHDIKIINVMFWEAC